MEGYAEKTIYLNEDPFNIKPVITINGLEKGLDAPIKDGDEVTIEVTL